MNRIFIYIYLTTLNHNQGFGNPQKYIHLHIVWNLFQKISSTWGAASSLHLREAALSPWQVAGVGVGLIWDERETNEQIGPNYRLKLQCCSAIQVKLNKKHVSCQ